MVDWDNNLVPKRNRFLSPLMLRIMAVNMIALVTFVAGILYLNEFRERLLETRTNTLISQAEIIAGALGESAVLGPETDEIDLVPARQIINRLVGPTQFRVRLFGPEGGILVDSVELAGDKLLVADLLPDPSVTPLWTTQLEDLAFIFLDFFLQRPSAPPVVDRPGLRAGDLIEVMGALSGDQASLTRRDSENQDVINVAVPVQRFRRVLGALLLTAQTEDIDDVVRAEQISLFRVFLTALFLTLLLSFFLSRTLVDPIRQLARAAEDVRQNPGKDRNIPKFSAREDEIGDLSRSLDLMTRALYNQIDAVERFAADVAHELKNPITSMRSALETLELTDREDIKERLLAILREDVQRLDRLISDISEASRLDAELTRGEKTPIDLSQLLSNILESYKAIADDPKVDLAIETKPKAEELSYVLGSDARLGQVFRNLIDNALSFAPENSSIRIGIEAGNRFLRVFVRDEGPGLPEGAAEKIFKRFYSERPDQSFGNHSGLGLAIVKQIVEAHGGRVTATNYSVDGETKGAEFMVALPLMPGKSGDW